MTFDGEQAELVREIVQQEIRTFAALLAYELGAMGETSTMFVLNGGLANALTNASDRLLRGETP